MARVVMRPLDSREMMQGDSAEAAAAIIKPNDRLTSGERLQIYNQQYWWRLLGAFGEDFRGLRAVLGERKFHRLAVAYLDGCGSTSWSLRNLGQHLESFLREHPELTAPHGHLSLDMVRAEWASTVAFDGPEKPCLDPQRLAGRPPSRIRLDLQPYITLLEVHHPIDQLLRRLKRTESAYASNAVMSGSRVRRPRLAARPTAQPLHFAAHRVDFSVYYKRLDPEAYRLLEALRAGKSLESACAEAFQDSPEPPEKAAGKIQAWFASWMRFGWLCERSAKTSPGV
jgi:hypothetical protein